MKCDLSIIIVSYNTRNILKSCLDSIHESLKRSFLKFEIFIVDNNSSDNTQEMIKNTFPSVHLIENIKNVGFSKANNQAIGLARGRYLLLLNPDTIVFSKSLHLMIEFMEANRLSGIITPKLVDRYGAVQPSVGNISSPFMVFLRFCIPRVFFSAKLKRLLFKSKLRRFFGNQMNSYYLPFTLDDPQEVETASGACLLVRRDVIKQVGCFDEAFFMYSEDMDFCLRVRNAGWKILYFPKAMVLHLSGKSSGGEFQPWSILRRAESYDYFFRKHNRFIDRTEVKCFLLFGLLMRLPWFLYHCVRPRRIDYTLWNAYRKTLINVIHE